MSKAKKLLALVGDWSWLSPPEELLGEDDIAAQRKAHREKSDASDKALQDYIRDKKGPDGRVGDAWSKDDKYKQLTSIAAQDFKVYQNFNRSNKETPGEIEARKLRRQNGGKQLP